MKFVQDWNQDQKELVHLQHWDEIGLTPLKTLKVTGKGKARKSNDDKFLHDNSWNSQDHSDYTWKYHVLEGLV